MTATAQPVAPSTAAPATSPAGRPLCPALRLRELEVLRKGREWGKLEVQAEVMWVAPGLSPVTFVSPVFRCRPGEKLLPRLLVTPPLGVDFVLWTLVVQDRDRRAAALGQRLPELLGLSPVQKALRAASVAAGGPAALLPLAVKAAAAIARAIGRPDQLLTHTAYAYPSMPTDPIVLEGPAGRAAARAVLVPEPVGA